MIRTPHLSYFLFFLCFMYACSSSTPEEVEQPPSTASKPNILLIIADDLGKDATPNFTEGSTKPNMSTLQSLMNSGITFDNVWSYPVCTPTRASILTGKYGIKTGVIEVGDVISTGETSVQRYINSNTGNAYATAIIGKWHLSNNANDPAIMGIDYFAGLLNGGVQSYTNWNLTENGSTNTSTEYTTTKFTDLAINWIDQQNKPWFLWLAYNAPHTPFHLAPTNLHSQGNLPTDQASITANPIPYYMSAVEAMDNEIGRLLQSLTAEERANTIIVFIGDNGSPNQVAQSPYATNRAKGTLYQGGVNVPMIVSGFGVDRGGVRENGLVHTTDLYTTLAQVAGVNTSSIHNSSSFYNVLSTNSNVAREYVYVEGVRNNGVSGYAIRNATYKLLVYANGNEQLYHLGNDPYENTNLLNGTLTAEASAAKTALLAEANRIRN